MKTALLTRFAQLAAAGCVGFSVSTSSFAETLTMPEGNTYTQTAGSEKWNVPLPRKGMNKVAVEASFGMPMSKNGPTGEPPIYYWEYDAFTVYFESDFVIHTVRKYKP